ncbi:muscle-specific protein 300 kDa-like [Hyalella azteca]|uniref:Muscle-specific protein 300 kDa-like n=1 Tax=Hyalella azteca TaxID=294128 RepID=A0A8B7P3D3_HYAAZ|nr:muscle-specific protein 300 kDa-like [Hyalella azteca]
MTFWQENYGFVKEVYDFRLAKYQEWMDNLEGIVSKVLSQNVQYTYKEFKIIQDSLTSLCRDLEKEGMKEWLDLMLEKVAIRASDEGGPSSRDKELRNAEKKKLQALIERHDKLMPPTIETQAKVEMYARCYAYGDDIKPTMKTLEEMRHLSSKEIHPHNMNMVEEQIEKAEKVINTVESSREQYEELLKRGQKLVKGENVAPFLFGLLEKLEQTWAEANEKSKARLEMLTNSAKDWETYDEMRNAINEPIEKLEKDYKNYRKFYDPVMFAKKLASKKQVWEECKKQCDEMYQTIKKCYNTIIVLAGDEKKEFLDREVAEVEEKMQIIEKCEKKLLSMSSYNDRLTDAVNRTRALQEWASPSNSKLKEICTSDTLTPEDRVKEILILQEEANQKRPLLEPLTADYKALLTDEDLEKSETAKTTLADFEETKKFVEEVCDDIEKEATSISVDDRLYADYYCIVKEAGPWVDDAEAKSKEPLTKPQTLEDALALLENLQAFDGVCLENKSKLEDAAKARASMEKPSNTENMVEKLTPRWEGVKKVSEERIGKIETLVKTWQELKSTTEDLATKMSEVPKQDEPNIEELEKVFTSMKDLFAKKKELIGAV